MHPRYFLRTCPLSLCYHKQPWHDDSGDEVSCTILVCMLNICLCLCICPDPASVIAFSLSSTCELPEALPSERLWTFDPPWLCTYTECIWQFQLCVFGNHYGTTILAKHLKLFEQKLIMQLFNLFIVLLMFFADFHQKITKSHNLVTKCMAEHFICFSSKSNE